MGKKWKKRGKSPCFILLGGIITEFEWATIEDARLTGKMTEITEKKQTGVAEVEGRGGALTERLSLSHPSHQGVWTVHRRTQCGAASVSHLNLHLKLSLLAVGETRLSCECGKDSVWTSRKIQNLDPLVLLGLVRRWRLPESKLYCRSDRIQQIIE